jgi:hypothetical protein
VAVLAALALAPVAMAQPIRRVAGLDEPFGGFALPGDNQMSPAAPVGPRTTYQPPRDPNGTTGEPDFALPDGALIPVPQSRSREYRIGRRYGTPNNLEKVELAPGYNRYLLTGGWVVNAASFDGQEATEFAADEIVIWTRGRNVDIQKGFTTDGDGRTEVEMYMSGNVVIRSTSGTGLARTTQTLRAVEVYYDVEHNKAIAVHANIEILTVRTTDPLLIVGDEVRRLDFENWDIINGTISGSKLPSDPGLRLESERFVLNEHRTVRRNFLGIPFRSLATGEEVVVPQKILTGQNVVTRLADVPVFYTPDMVMNVNDPLGPLRSLTFNTNRVFGTGFYSSFDIFNLLALVPPPGDRWRLNLDYMSKRGPAGGTDYNYLVPGAAPGEPSIGAGMIKLYAISDKGFDILGGFRGPEPMPSQARGRFLWRDQRELTDELYFQGQGAYLSDMNFLEQYYKNEFNLYPNQETFAYLAWQRRNFGANALVEARVDRRWVDETNSLPRVNGELIGQTFLNDLFVYSSRASAGYFQTRPAEGGPAYPLLQTDLRDNTGRFDVWQELDVPLALGPVKFVPYGVLQLTDYTNALTGPNNFPGASALDTTNVGRIYGGGGARASVPFSRLYENVCSELLNLNGLYHKVVASADYRYARTNVPFTQLPLIDRLNDDSTDQGWRNMTAYQTLFVPGPNGVLLQNAPGYSPFNPQLYAIRRVVENRIDTLDNIDVLQMDLRQRFQTKRGYPGAEHTVDVLTFDLSASYFPEARRDNFGHPFAFLEYATTWNVGDRTALVSNGWFEPYQNGSRYWNAGVYLNRTDRTNLYIGYRQTDPLNSKAVSMVLGYKLSTRYYLNIGANYDFGLGQALSNSLTLTRTGTDLTVTIGFTYTAFVNSFGFQFMVIPNLALLSGANAGALSPQALGARR